MAGVRNPVYWARMDLRNGQRRRQSYNSIQKFNERWARLQRIQNLVSNDFVDELLSENDSLTEKEYDTLIGRIEEMRAWVEAISDGIDIATNAHLSKYATHIKNVALMAIKLCRKYEQDAVVYLGPEAKGDAVLLFKNGSSQSIGKFNPSKIAQAYSRVRGGSFVFEGWEYIAQTSGEALIDDSMQVLYSVK